MGRQRAFCIMSQRVVVRCKIKCVTYEVEAKASLNRAFKYLVADPKPDDLSMSRLKLL